MSRSAPDTLAEYSWVSRSWGRRWVALLYCITSCSRPRWFCSTPLGSPVEPEVNSNQAGSEPRRGRGAVSSVASVSLEAPEERALARQLLNFGLALNAVADECRPNYLCNYLYELAGLSSRFYEECPVLKSEEPVRGSRLALCHLTAMVLRQGLDCLGIGVSDRM